MSSYTSTDEMVLDKVLPSQAIKLAAPVAEAQAEAERAEQARKDFVTYVAEDDRPKIGTNYFCQKYSVSQT